MRILLIAGEYPPLQGGLGDYTRELARALAMAGHEPHVFTKFAHDAPREELASSVYVHRAVPRWGWEALYSLRRCLQATQPEVLNLQYQAAAYNMHAAINLLPRLFSGHIPTVVTFHDLKVPYLFPKAGPLRRQAIEDMARSASATIVTNVEDQMALARVHTRHLSTIPIGSNIAPVPLDHFDRTAWLDAHDMPASACVVGYFGFMNESKGGETLIRALAELRQRGLDVRLLLIGGQTGESDPTNAEYGRLIMQLAGELHVREHIVITGFLDNRGVSESLAACDCVALPYRDGASFRRGTLMAALAHGCAIVTTTPRVDVPELRNEENVLLTAAGKWDALADAIVRLWLNADLRARLQRGSRQLSTRFSWDRIAAETAIVFEHVLLYR